MERIIIDTDLGVDDAVGIALALANDEIQVEGLTIVSSIGKVEESIVNAAKVLKACNRGDLGIYRGANHPLEKEIIKVGQFEEKYLERFDVLPVSEQKAENEVAVDYMIRMVEENPNEITIVAMGPLTNLAIAIQKDPQFIKRVKRLVISGGAEFGGNCTPVSEFNFWGDPHAAKKIFQAGFEELIMIGLDATRQIEVDETSIEKLAQIETEGAKLAYELVKDYVAQDESTLRKSRGIIDGALAIAYLINEQVISTKASHVCIETKGISTGQSIVDVEGMWNVGKCNCNVADIVNKELFTEILNNRFC